MFKDIIGESTKKKKLDLFENTDCCPYCGSENVGTSRVDLDTRGLIIFCWCCGQSWLVNK